MVAIAPVFPVLAAGAVVEASVVPVDPPPVFPLPVFEDAAVAGAFLWPPARAAMMMTMTTAATAAPTHHFL
jgi:hypothetical protein